MVNPGAKWFSSYYICYIYEGTVCIITLPKRTVFFVNLRARVIRTLMHAHRLDTTKLSMSSAAVGNQSDSYSMVTKWVFVN